jgi:hypothetical protein
MAAAFILLVILLLGLSGGSLDEADDDEGHQ